jgi:hypothetical protein
VVVDVKPSDGPRIVVPVPLFLAHAALSFGSRGRPSRSSRARQIPRDRRKTRGGARGCADGILVEVDDRENHVSSRDRRQIAVRSRATTRGHRRIPSRRGVGVLNSYDGRPDSRRRRSRCLSSSSSLSGPTWCT